MFSHFTLPRSRPYLLHPFLLLLGLLLISTSTLRAQNVPCDAATSQTNATSGLCVGCYVDKPDLAVDNDTTTASSLHVILGLLGGYAEQTLQFPFTGNTGDSIRLLLSFPVNLLDLGVLSSVQVATYNGTIYNGDRKAINAVALRLISPERAEVTLLATKSYNRVEVRLNSGVLQLLNAVNIHYASRLLTAPKVAKDTVTICEGNTATLQATAPAGVTFNWYTQATGGTAVSAGATFITPVLYTTTTYYVAAVSASGCASKLRTPVKVVVNPAPSTPIALGDTLSICTGSRTTLKAIGDSGNVFKWYLQETGGTAIFTGATFVTPVLTATTVYYVEAVDNKGCSSQRSSVTVTVNPLPAQPDVKLTPACKGQNATLAVVTPVAGTVYSWYATATSVTPLAIGNTFSFRQDSTSITYFVSATRNGCISVRKAITATALPAPLPPTVAKDTVAICKGATATLQATGPAGATFSWYTQATGGTSVFTGATFITPALSATTTYYVAATATSGCASTVRTPVTVVVNPLPATPVVQGEVPAVCTGGSTRVRVRIIDSSYVFNWYLQPAGGTAIFTGATFNTPALTDTTTYYVEAVNSQGCSSARLSITVIVNPLPPQPDVTLTPACIGQNATLSVVAPVAGTSYSWTKSNGVVLTFGNSYTFRQDSASVTYFVSASRNGCSSARKAVTATALPTPAPPTVAKDTVFSHAGDSVRLSATSSNPISWYNAATGGTRLFQGSVYVVAPTATTTYYVQADGTSGCSSARKPVTVKVLPNGAGPSGAIAIYKFSNNLNDASGNNYNGTATTGSVGYQQDVVANQAGLFNNTFVTIKSGATSSSILPKKTLTAAYWVNIASSSSVETVVVNGSLQDNQTEGGWGVGYQNSSMFFFLQGANNTAGFYLRGDQNIQNNTWYHVVATYDGTTMSLYLNGALYASTTTVSGDIVYQGLNSDVFGIGAFQDENEFYPVNGRIDEVYVYGRTLSATEVKTFYDSYQFGLVEPFNRPASGAKTPVATSQATSNTAKVSNTLKVFPNPSGGEIKLEGLTDFAGSFITVTDLQGRRVQQDVLKGNTYLLKQPAGIYVITVTTAQKKVMQTKVVIQ
ncbi:Ig-like domain-containing protein [Chitinophaga nivalis]|uniref:T9SS type A sorting domain-containing protein n=1 Tax=Chitinophaga nivalis TaxID=2991709 RepID=A0ABT3INC0_9BACT|nr:LamG-like jellyroll fold domain-containing protein [Chitinophaga nivalis]MCW3464827.1 T9SS type A sorting domain-containing protein [Chitinophaga nivalis]MCW3485482.1 T9SS type A sorting domain-containing protein [Chitinophaga nivalis]